jgi:hypothetical protein
VRITPVAFLSSIVRINCLPGSVHSPTQLRHEPTANPPQTNLTCIHYNPLQLPCGVSIITTSFSPKAPLLNQNAPHHHPYDFQMKARTLGGPLPQACICKTRDGRKSNNGSGRRCKGIHTNHSVRTILEADILPAPTCHHSIA